MKRFMKRIAILLVVTLLSPTFFSFIPALDSLTTEEVSAAAAKAELFIKETTIGIASSPEYISIKNTNWDAVYTYTSANPKIVKVSEYGLVEGVSKGKTTITVKETLNKKTTVVGKMTVNVVGPKLDIKKVDVGLNATTYVSPQFRNNNAKYIYKSSDTKTVKIDEYGGVVGVKYGKATVTLSEEYKGKTTKVGSFTVNVVNGKLADKTVKVPVSSYNYSGVYILCRNPKATYKYKSADSKIATVNAEGDISGIKKGTTTISVTETYNKKTVNIGTLTVKVVGAAIDASSKEIEIGINSTNSLTSMIYLNYKNWDAAYVCSSSDNSVVLVSKDSEGNNSQVKGVALGTATLTIYEKYKSEKTKVGTVKVTVKEIPVTIFYFDAFWLEEVDGKYVATFELDDYWPINLSYYYYMEPYNSTTPVTFSSSDKAVAMVDENSILTPVGEGEAVITVTCGKFTFKFTVIVTASEMDYDDEDWDWDYEEEYDW